MSSKEKQPPVVTVAPQVEEFWDVDPLGALYDVVTGAAFDEPKVLTKGVENAERSVGQESSERETRSSGSIVNITLGDAFKRSKKPKSVAGVAGGATATTTEAEKAESET